MPNCSFGIFVGGRARRMGGVAKGKLRLSNQQTLIGRLIGECRAAEPDARVSLVGAGSDYSEFGLPELADDPPGIGPISGLLSLLREGTKTSDSFVIALACDLPFLSRGLIRRLIDEPGDSLALAAKQENFWQPLAARYSVRALPALEAMVARGQRSFQRFFGELGPGAVELPTTSEELSQLRDWDSPEDVRLP